MPKQVVIVGAGPGGLASAMLLAKSGLSVRVIERMPHVGGRTSSLEGDGFQTPPPDLAMNENGGALPL